MPPPPLAVVRAGQQIVDEPLEGVGPLVRDERPHLVRRGRQSPQIEIDPANEPGLRNRLRRLPAVPFEPGQDEPIHRALNPGSVLHDRQSRTHHGPERPQRAGIIGTANRGRRHRANTDDRYSQAVEHTPALCAGNVQAALSLSQPAAAFNQSRVDAGSPRVDRTTERLGSIASHATAPIAYAPAESAKLADQP